MKSLDKILYAMGPSVLTEPLNGKQERSLVSPVLEGVRLRAQRRRALRIKLLSAGLLAMVVITAAAVFVGGFSNMLAQAACVSGGAMAGFRDYVGATVEKSTLLTATGVVATLTLVVWAVSTIRGANRPARRQPQSSRDRSAS